MLARRTFRLFLLATLALFCPGCACAPDRWTLTEKTTENARTGRWRNTEIDLSLSGPIPPLFHE